MNRNVVNDILGDAKEQELNNKRIKAEEKKKLKEAEKAEKRRKMFSVLDAREKRKEGMKNTSKQRQISSIKFVSDNILAPLYSGEKLNDDLWVLKTRGEFKGILANGAEIIYFNTQVVDYGTKKAVELHVYYDNKNSDVVQHDVMELHPKTGLPTSCYSKDIDKPYKVVDTANKETRIETTTDYDDYSKVKEDIIKEQETEKKWEAYHRNR